MSSYPEHNFPAFREAAKILRSLGHEVTSPVEMDESEGFDSATAPDVTPGSQEWAAFLSRDVRVVASEDIEAVVVLDGWEKSRGAALEVHVARELGKPVYRIALSSGLDMTQLLPVKAPTKYQPPSGETVLETAARLVDGDRGDTYGHPVHDFERTAGAWRALFGWEVDARRVALAMICVKLSRLVQTPDHRDSVVDTGGYARTYEAVAAREGAPGFRDLGQRE